MKKLLMALVAVFIVGCPNPQTGKTDPWLTARAVILQARNALPIADSLFMQWTFGQSDEKTVKEKSALFYKIKTGVLDGFQVALDGVDIAEQAKKEPDVTKLLAQANKAWADLHTMIGNLLGAKPEPVPDDSMVKSTTHALTAATSQPAKVESPLLSDFKKLPKVLK